MNGFNGRIDTPQRVHGLEQADSRGWFLVTGLVNAMNKVAFTIGYNDRLDVNRPHVSIPMAKPIE